MKYKELKSIYYANKLQYNEECRNRKSSISSCLLNLDISGNESFVVSTCELMTLIESIYSEAMTLDRMCMSLPDVAYKSYARKCLIDEIILTNDIEGVTSTRKEVIDVLENVKEDKKKRFQGLVKKYELLMTSGELNIPLDRCEDVRALYDEIVSSEVEESHLPDGKIFRNSTVIVLSPTQKEKHQGVYPESAIIENMKQALTLLKDESIPKLVRIAVFHYFIGYIHPFYDGNGRLSRFLSSYMLSKTMNPLVAYRLSYIIKSKRDVYYKAFDICNDKKNYGDVTPFVLVFLEIVLESIANLMERLEEGMEQLEFYEKLIHKNEAANKGSDERKNLIYILTQNELFSGDSLGVEDLAENTGYSNAKVRRMLEDLINQGLPIIINKERRKNVYSLSLDALADFYEIPKS